VSGPSDGGRMIRLTALGLGLLTALTVVGDRAGASDTPLPPSGTTTDLTAEQVELLGWALGQFDDAGLDLPPMVVVGHDTTEPCRGRIGIHRVEERRSVIRLCTRETGPARELLYLHELAHAWDWHALSEERRRAFLRLRGLEAWSNNDPDRWGERGGEHAAEIVTWGLMDRPVEVIRIEPNTCDDLLTGYVTLVGRAPLHGFTDYCDGPVDRRSPDEGPGGPPSSAGDATLDLAVLTTAEGWRVP
jgi:hypothetical protein